MTLQMGAICFFKISVDFHQTVQNYIPEDTVLHNHCSENLKLVNLKICLQFILLKDVFLVISNHILQKR